MSWGLFSAAVAAGAVSFLSPCIVPMLTAYLTLLTGLSSRELAAANGGGAGEAKARSLAAALWGGSMFVLAFTVVFTGAGAAAGRLGKALAGYLPVINVFGGAAIAFLGLGLAGVVRADHFKWLLPQRNTTVPRWAQEHPGARGFVGGLFFALACSHCISYTLYSVLLFAGTTGSPAAGAGVMAAFSFGLAVPYLLAAASLGSGLAKVRGLARHQRALARVTGYVLVIFGILVVTGRFTSLAGVVPRLVPRWLRLGM